MSLGESGLILSIQVILFGDKEALPVSSFVADKTAAMKLPDIHFESRVMQLKGSRVSNDAHQSRTCNLSVT